jgi:hypothetical protein
MNMSANPETVIKELSRLRRLSRAETQVARELEPTVALLTLLVGPTVKRSVAARFLGISQTALDKWITSGEIATTRTPAGRTEVPVGELPALLDDRRPLAAAIRRRRERSLAEIGIDLLPWAPISGMPGIDALTYVRLPTTAPSHAISMRAGSLLPELGFRDGGRRVV